MTIPSSAAPSIAIRPASIVNLNSLSIALLPLFVRHSRPTTAAGSGQRSIGNLRCENIVSVLQIFVSTNLAAASGAVGRRRVADCWHDRSRRRRQRHGPLFFE
jgi:hypothetical protein